MLVKHCLKVEYGDNFSDFYAFKLIFKWINVTSLPGANIMNLKEIRGRSFHCGTLATHSSLPFFYCMHSALSPSAAMQRRCLSPTHRPLPPSVRQFVVNDFTEGGLHSSSPNFFRITAVGDLLCYTRILWACLWKSIFF